VLSQSNKNIEDQVEIDVTDVDKVATTSHIGLALSKTLHLFGLVSILLLKLLLQLLKGIVLVTLDFGHLLVKYFDEFGLV
jgi:hypothetical protein